MPDILAHFCNARDKQADWLYPSACLFYVSILQWLLHIGQIVRDAGSMGCWLVLNCFDIEWGVWAVLALLWEYACCGRYAAKKSKRQEIAAAGGGAEFCRTQCGKIERKMKQMKAGFHLLHFALGPAFGRAPRRPPAIQPFAFCFSSPHIFRKSAERYFYKQ